MWLLLVVLYFGKFQPPVKAASLSTRNDVLAGQSIIALPRPTVTSDFGDFADCNVIGSTVRSGHGYICIVFALITAVRAAFPEELAAMKPKH